MRCGRSRAVPFQTVAGSAICRHACANQTPGERRLLILRRYVRHIIPRTRRLLLQQRCRHTFAKSVCCPCRQLIEKPEHKYTPKNTREHVACRAKSLVCHLWPPVQLVHDSELRKPRNSARRNGWLGTCCRCFAAQRALLPSGGVPLTCASVAAAQALLAAACC